MSIGNMLSDAASQGIASAQLRATRKLAAVTLASAIIASSGEKVSEATALAITDRLQAELFPD